MFLESFSLLMGNHTRDQLKLFPESDLFGVLPKKLKTKNFAVILCLTHDLSGLEKLNFATLCLDIGDLPTVRLSCFLDQFLSTFNNRNHSVKFQDLKLSAKILIAHYFETYSKK